KGDLPLMHWSCQHTLYEAQQALVEVMKILPFSGGIGRLIIFPFGKPYSSPTDKLVHQTASILLNDTETRDRLTHGIYVNDREDDATGRIECAFKAVLAAIPVEKKIRQAQKNGLLVNTIRTQLLDNALEINIITLEERGLLDEAERMRSLAIEVDDFETLKV
ncbi:MAG TPA: DUF1974 domain-containing protein, partial [Candidatus Thioglobus sp.]|nr:DUF1974 domain-containing protein [Candidatus Thioglobus sp.]